MTDSISMDIVGRSLRIKIETKKANPLNPTKNMELKFYTPISGVVKLLQRKMKVVFFKMPPQNMSMTENA